MRVTCSEFRANFGRYLDITLTEPVIITNFARDQGVLISAEIFHALRARKSAELQKPPGETITIPITDFQKAYAHYQEVALSNPIIITTHFREKTVLLSPADFDELFEGSLPEHVHATLANTPAKIPTSEFQQKVGQYLIAAIESPIIITKHGREKNALLSVGAFRDLLRGKAAKAENEQAALTVTATEFQNNTGYYQDISITRPVIIAVKEVDQNVLVSAESFKRLSGVGDVREVSNKGRRPLPLAELRGKYSEALSIPNRRSAGPVPPLPLLHDHQLHQHLPQRPKPRQSDCGDEEEDDGGGAGLNGFEIAPERNCKYPGISRLTWMDRHHAPFLPHSKDFRS
jgi:prevent-host-death family protein